LIILYLFHICLWISAFLHFYYWICLFCFFDNLNLFYVLVDLRLSLKYTESVTKLCDIKILIICMNDYLWSLNTTNLNGSCYVRIILWIDYPIGLLNLSRVKNSAKSYHRLRRWIMSFVS
jgi:hypothetical protein